MDDDLLEFQFEGDACHVAVRIANLDMMEPLDLNLFHFRCDRVFAIAGKAIDARAYKEMRAKILA